MSDLNLTVIKDSAQRTIIGELITETKTEITIKNPVVVNIVEQFDDQGRPNGQMALQLLPDFFKEFQHDKSAPVFYKYPINQITRIEVEGGFDFRLHGQYTHIFSNQPVATNEAPPVQKKVDTPVLNLFDEEK